MTLEHIWVKMASHVTVLSLYYYSSCPFITILWLESAFRSSLELMHRRSVGSPGDDGSKMWASEFGMENDGEIVLAVLWLDEDVGESDGCRLRGQVPSWEAGRELWEGEEFWEIGEEGGLMLCWSGLLFNVVQRGSVSGLHSLIESSYPMLHDDAGGFWWIVTYPFSSSLRLLHLLFLCDFSRLRNPDIDGLCGKPLPTATLSCLFWDMSHSMVALSRNDALEGPENLSSLLPAVVAVSAIFTSGVWCWSLLVDLFTAIFSIDANVLESAASRETPCSMYAPITTPSALWTPPPLSTSPPSNDLLPCSPVSSSVGGRGDCDNDREADSVRVSEVLFPILESGDAVLEVLADRLAEVLSSSATLPSLSPSASSALRSSSFCRLSRSFCLFFRSRRSCVGVFFFSSKLVFESVAVSVFSTPEPSLSPLLLWLIGTAGTHTSRRKSPLIIVIEIICPNNNNLHDKDLHT